MSTPEEDLILMLSKMMGKDKKEATKMVENLKNEMLRGIPGAGQKTSASSKKPEYSEENFPKYLKRENVLRYTLRITLTGIKPAIWRKITIPSNASLRLLGDLTLDLMGWDCCHLNEIRAGRDDIYYPYYQREDHGEEIALGTDGRNQEDYAISDVLKEKGKGIILEYDFGDSWRHEIKLSSVEDYAEGEARKIHFIGGKRACPPDDCGGIWGYQELLALYEKRKAGKRLIGEDKERYDDYCGSLFDPEELDLEDCEDVVDMYNEES